MSLWGLDALLMIDSRLSRTYRPRSLSTGQDPPRLRRDRSRTKREDVMKVRSSLKSLKTRHRDCKLVRRKGRVYVINKTDPRFKAKQG